MMDSNHQLGAIPVEPDYKRKPNFTDMEKLYLLQQYSIFKPILASKLCDGATTRQKQDTWNQIAMGLNQQNPTVERTAKEVKKKWENLATLARKEIAEFRSGTGRSLLRPPSALTLKILELIDDISYNPPSDANFAVVKEEIWDDDTDSAEMSPPNHNNSFNNVNETSPSVVAAVQNFANSILPPYSSAGPSSVPYETQAPTSVRPPTFVGQSFTLKRPATPRQQQHDDTDGDDDLLALKRRKLRLESEKLELENEKLRLETEMLRFKLNSMKKRRHSTTTNVTTTPPTTSYTSAISVQIEDNDKQHEKEDDDEDNDNE